MPEPKILTDNIPHEYILMPNIKHAFDPEGVGLNWSLEECEFKKSSNQYISAVYYLKDTNYAVVDIDTDDYSLDQLYDDTGIDNMWVKGNTKGFHVWVEFPKGKPDAYRKNVVNCSNLCEMDYLGEKVFERVGKTWTGEFPCHIHAEQFEKCFIMDKFTTKTKTENNKQESSGDKALLKKLVDLIHMKYCDNRDDWLKIVYAMKKCGFTEKEATEWSMKSDRYTESGFDSAWEQYPVDLITAGEGTIRYYAKLSNPTEYKKMTVKESVLTYKTEDDFANLFWQLKGDCCIYADGVKYIYFKNAWREVHELDILRHFINTTLKEYFHSLLEIYKDNQDAYRKILDFLDGIVGKSHWIANITKQFTDRLVGEQIDQEDVFDKKPHIFAFKNIGFDLNTRKEYKVQKEDYITQNTNNEYIEPSQDDVNTIDKLFTQIFPDTEVRKCYLSVLFISMTGEHPENLFLANGCGRNGKGLINELMFELMGDYAYKLSIDVLTKEMKRTGANPELANVHKKRLTLANEPEDNVKLLMGIIKELTGGNETTARALYSNRTKTLLHLLLLVECNKKPLIAGRIDTSVLERIVDIPFEACFVSNQEDVDESKYIYLKNTEYKTESWRKKHYSALFRYLLNNAPAKLYIPDRIKNLSKQYVLGSDEMYGWVMENYETADNTEFVKLKDVFDLYKASDLYSNLTKLEKRNLNKNAFSELISHHIVLKKQFRNDKVKIAGKSVNCERVHGLKLKPIDDCDTDDEELGHQP
jgi:phage/plasmid-associated DNA primase